MKKRLIALMLGATIASSTLIGCADSGAFNENEDKIRQMLEYDANTNISRSCVEHYGLRLQFEIKDSKFYITFMSRDMNNDNLIVEDDVKIKYEVNKDTYYDFKNNYNSYETTEDVDRVKVLTEKYDPISVENSDEKIVERQ